MPVAAPAGIAQNSANLAFATNKNFLANGAAASSWDLKKNVTEEYKKRLNLLIKLIDNDSAYSRSGEDNVTLIGNAKADAPHFEYIKLTFQMENFLKEAVKSLNKSLIFMAFDDGEMTKEQRIEKSAQCLKDASANLYWAFEDAKKAQQAYQRFENQVKNFYFTPKQIQEGRKFRAFYERLISDIEKLRTDYWNSCVKAEMKI